MFNIIQAVRFLDFNQQPLRFPGTVNFLSVTQQPQPYKEAACLLNFTQQPQPYKEAVSLLNYYPAALVLSNSSKFLKELLIYV